MVASGYLCGLTTPKRGGASLLRLPSLSKPERIAAQLTPGLRIGAKSTKQRECGLEDWRSLA
jgi:hypothetical protein